MTFALVGLGTFFYLDIRKEVKCHYNNFTITTTTGSPCVEKDGYSEELLDNLGWLPLASLIIYKFAFSLGYGPLSWMMNGKHLRIMQIATKVCTVIGEITTYI